METGDHGKRSRRFVALYDHVWSWYRRHHEKIMQVDPYPPLTISRGVIGHRKGTKGSPFGSNDLHPAFIRYLQAPESVKVMAEVLERLQRENPELYAYIYLRSHNWSLQEMQDTGLFSSKLIKPSGDKKKFADRLNKASIQLFLENLPDHVTENWVRDTLREEVLGYDFSQSRQARNRWRMGLLAYPCPFCTSSVEGGCLYCTGPGEERVPCPECNGAAARGGSCTLCTVDPYNDPTPGYVKRRFARTYKRKMDAGAWVQRPS